MTTVQPRIVLEPAAQDLADATAKPPFLYDLGPEGARKALDDLQAQPTPPPWPSPASRPGAT